MTLEENKDIFDALLKLMKKLTLVVVATQPLPLVVASQDPDDMPIQPWKFI